MPSVDTALVTVRLNGDATPVPVGTTLGALLDGKGIERRMIAVEYNREILPRRAYDEIVLREDDELEIVHMVGGG